MKKLKVIASYFRLITCLLLHRNFGNKFVELMVINQVKIMALIHCFLCPRVMCPKIVKNDETWCNAKINFIILAFLIYIIIYKEI